MALKTNIYVDKPNKQNSTLRMSVSLNGRDFINLPEIIETGHWDKKTQRLLTNTKESNSFVNSRLDSYEKKAENIYNRWRLEDKYPVYSDIIKELDIFVNGAPTVSKREEKKIDFWSFVDEFVKSRKKIAPRNPGGNRNSRINSYEQAIALLKDYQTEKKIKIDFGSFDQHFYADFVGGYMGSKKKFSKNNGGKHIQVLKTFLNAANEEELMPNKKYKKYKVLESPVDFVVLSDEEIEKLANLPLEGGRKTQRDLFIVACYTGLRYSDFGVLKPENFRDGYIHRIQEKTDQPVVIPIHPRLLPLLEQYNYNLPRVYENQKINEILKKICKDAELFQEKVLWREYLILETIEHTCLKYEMITTHTGRRSFATILFKEGFPTPLIMSITGHKTLKHFHRYIGVSLMEGAQMLKKHWVDKFQKKDAEANVEI